MSQVKKPWLKYYNDIPEFIECPELTLYEMLAQSASKYSMDFALEFMGKKITYGALLRTVNAIAGGLQENGLKYGDTVTMAMPNTPNAVILFYALNKLGVRIAMVHPLSSNMEMLHYINETDSKWVITVDMFYKKFASILEKTKVERMLITKISDYLPTAKSFIYTVLNKRKNAVPSDNKVIFWNAVASSNRRIEVGQKIEPREGAVVLFSGGTSDLPKGILLSAYAFNALAVQMKEITKFSNKDSVLAILPIFHGFGLGLCVHTALCVGAMSILIPQFSSKIYIKNLIKYKPSFIAGVPTLFEALLRDPEFKKAKFNKLKGAYSGGDSLSYDIKQRFDEAIKAQGSKVELAEGYGVTETVTGCVISPQGRYKPHSIGIPIPNMVVKIVKENTCDEIGIGEEGEICVTGPTLMNGYLNSPQATDEVLKKHEDGLTWLHTGDVGHMDQEGYLYFKSRLKRVFKVSGVNVFPTQVEGVLESHEDVWRACVIGVPDDYQVMSVKAYVVLRDKKKADDNMKKQLQEHCENHLIKWSVPRYIEFMDELPTTLVGKVAYTKLGKEK